MTLNTFLSLLTKEYCDFRACSTNIHEVTYVSLARANCGKSGTKGNVAVFQ